MKMDTAAVRAKMAAMKIKLVKLEKLVPYAQNSRTHSKTQIKQLAASMYEFGFTNPILIDEKGGIVAGHGRVLAASELGLTEAPCITLTGLTEAQKRAYVIADNKLALNSQWDVSVLRMELQALQQLNFDLPVLGFNTEGIADLLLPSVIETSSDVEVKEPKHTCPSCGQKFN